MLILILAGDTEASAAAAVGDAAVPGDGDSAVGGDAAVDGDAAVGGSFFLGDTGSARSLGDGGVSSITGSVAFCSNPLPPKGAPPGVMGGDSSDARLWKECLGADVTRLPERRPSFLLLGATAADSTWMTSTGVTTAQSRRSSTREYKASPLSSGWDSRSLFCNSAI
eukprot:Gregarina_sp_Pseudo_9__3956@NODE_40_length_5278_cov_10_517465_g37_i0_p4_GENE_NODE_40_length_5278_cov_10_517465_g37_i0NODE_40_length_5278_cov_10_517465_g37_i0_p4_ORF_typecomplete_len167_score37_60_NODE_40_length_5278_cov_10_517465_g37_i0293793